MLPFFFRTAGTAMLPFFFRTAGTAMLPFFSHRRDGDAPRFREIGACKLSGDFVVV